MTAIKRIVFISVLFASLIIGGIFLGILVSGNKNKYIEKSHSYFHETLNLTPEQLNKLIPLEKKFSEQKLFYENQIHQANIELGDVMKKEKAYTEEVKKAVEKVHAAMGQLQKVTIVHLFEMRKLLDATQAQIFDNYVADAMHEL